MSHRRLDLKVTHENPTSGLRTFELSPEAERAATDWLAERGTDIWQVARRVRRNARGRMTFKGGVGYAVVDADLLGGNADGTTERAFQNETGAYFFAR